MKKKLKTVVYIHFFYFKIDLFLTIDRCASSFTLVMFRSFVHVTYRDMYVDNQLTCTTLDSTTNM